MLSFETAARSLKVTPIIVPVHGDAEIEAAITALGRDPGGGLVLMPQDENYPRAKTYSSAVTQALADLGWTDGRNVRIDVRWEGGDTNRIRALALELVGLQPDIILTGSIPAAVVLQQETGTIPILFASVADPVASGIVALTVPETLLATADEVIQ